MNKTLPCIVCGFNATTKCACCKAIFCSRKCQLVLWKKDNHWNLRNLKNLQNLPNLPENVTGNANDNENETATLCGVNLTISTRPCMSPLCAWSKNRSVPIFEKTKRKRK